MTNMTCAVGGVLGSAGKRGPMAACAYSTTAQGCGLPTEEACEHRQNGKSEPLDLGAGKHGCPYCKAELEHMGGLLHECLNDDCAEHGAQWFINN